MSTINTRVNDMVQASPNLDQWTLKPSRYGQFDAFHGGNDEAESIISKELFDQAASTVGTDVKVPVYDSESVSIGSTRLVTIADSENTSQMYTLSFTKYYWGFTVLPTSELNNYKSTQADFNRKFKKYLFKFADVLDTACGTALSTAKSQIMTDLLSLYSNVGNVMVAPLALEDEVIGDLSVVMKSNDFYGTPYTVVGNTGLESRIGKLHEKGIYQDSNKDIQFNDKQFRFSNNIANAVGHKATGYIINPGSVGLAFRHEAEALNGTQTPTHKWGIMTAPVLNIPLDTYYYYGVSDNSALGGAATAHLDRTVKEHYGFGIEVATVTAYNTNLATDASPILKFAIADV